MRDTTATRAQSRWRKMEISTLCSRTPAHSTRVRNVRDQRNQPLFVSCPRNQIKMTYLKTRKLPAFSIPTLVSDRSELDRLARRALSIFPRHLLFAVSVRPIPCPIKPLQNGKVVSLPLDTCSSFLHLAKIDVPHLPPSTDSGLVTAMEGRPTSAPGIASHALQELRGIDI